MAKNPTILAMTKTSVEAGDDSVAQLLLDIEANPALADLMTAWTDAEFAAGEVDPDSPFVKDGDSVEYQRLKSIADEKRALFLEAASGAL